MLTSTAAGAGLVPPANPATVTVASGESVSVIARRYQVPMRDLIEANRLQAPYVLAIGQKLTLPATRSYTVKRGDTLSTVSHEIGVDQAELARFNDLTPPYPIRIGQRLRLPPLPGSTTVAAVPPVALPPQPATVTVPAGRATVESAALPSVSGSPSHADVPASPPSGPPESSAAPAAAVEPAKPAAAPEPAKPAAVPEPAKPAAVPPAPAMASSRFLWPVKGQIISRFGTKPDGLHNDGLNIAAAKGSAVVAAENGVVAYAGNELRGYGNLLLIRHADRWITAYAHLDRILVERGATVRRGQKIGTVGVTGSVTSPQLHFEVRRGSQAINPAPYLEGGAKISLQDSLGPLHNGG